MLSLLAGQMVGIGKMVLHKALKPFYGATQTVYTLRWRTIIREVK
jgi:hypothetical protein